MVVIGLTGLPGAGKSEFVKLARKKGFVVYRMGDAVWDYVRKKGLKLTNENVGRVATEERKKSGKGIWAERTLNFIKKEGNIVIDGVRSLEEVKLFKARFHDFILVALHASPETRFKRIAGRERIDDAKSKKDFLARDKRELGWGIGEVIKSADFLIVNEGSIGEFREDVAELLTRLQTC